MEKEHDVTVYMQFISLELVIPEEHVWDFMVQFGKEFAIRDPSADGSQTKSVDDYFSNPAGWHVWVTVWKRRESELYDFLRKFCSEKGISFRKPRVYV